VPQGIAALIMAAGGLLLARAASGWGGTHRAGPPGASDSPGRGDQPGAAGAAHPHLRALGLLGLLVLYVGLLPVLGYAISILLLAMAIAAYAGAAWRPALPAFALGTAAVLWAAFVLLLGVPLPAGRLLGG
jgi:hypothetical protein